MIEYYAPLALGLLVIALAGYMACHMPGQHDPYFTGKFDDEEKKDG